MRSRSLITLLLLPAALVLLIAPQALAAKRVPPGLSGANQYTETIPGAGGSESVRGMEGENGAAATPSKALGKDNAAKLEALGPEGSAAARAAAIGVGTGGGSGGPKPPSGTTPRAGAGGSAAKIGNAPDEARATGDSGSSAAGQIVDQITGSSGSAGMGWLLPFLIFATAVGAGAYVLGRRRTTSHRG